MPDQTEHSEPVDELDSTGPIDDFEWQLLFDVAPALDGELIRKGLLAHGYKADPILISEVTHEDDGDSHLSIDFDGHFMVLIRSPEPFPAQLMTKALDCANLPALEKSAMRKHKHHMVLEYRGGWDDPTEQMIAMLRVAAVFTPHKLLGVLDLPAWNAIAAARLPSYLKAPALAEMRRLPPLGVLAGFVKLFKSEDRKEVCFCTKGLHRWCVNDFAMNGKLKDAEEAFHLFENLFAHSLTLHNLIAPGHTAEVGKSILRFSEVSDPPEIFASPFGTLLLEKIKRADLH